MNKFKIGDQVQITSGRDKAKKGKVEKVFSRQSLLVVSGVNIYKRHRKVTKNQPAGIYEIKRPIATSKVALICPKCNKVTKIGFKVSGDAKTRICKKCEGVLS